MTPNQKQLEDFAYDISKAIEKRCPNATDAISTADVRKIAEELCKKGYIKVPETAVVIDKDYYNFLVGNM